MCKHLLAPLESCVASDLHEECVCHIQAPCVVLAAKLSTLSEDALHCTVLLTLPVDGCGAHKTYNQYKQYTGISTQLPRATSDGGLSEHSMGGMWCYTRAHACVL